MIIFSPGDNSTQCLSISPLDNDAVELQQSVTLALVSDDPGVNTSQDASTLIAIADDDSKSLRMPIYIIRFFSFQVLCQDLIERHIVFLKVNLLYRFVLSLKEH